MNYSASLPATTAGDPVAAGAAVRALRKERGETGEEFGKVIGLSKGKVSELESGKYEPSLPVALEIERLSIRDGIARIDAGTLCEAVARARAACPGGCFLGSELDRAAGHDGHPDKPVVSPVPTGQAGDLSGAPVQGAAA